MSEYIYASDGELLMDENYQLHLARKKITSCRDCKYCMAYAVSAYCDYMAHSIDAGLDGYCAWGEPREGE